MQSRLQNHEIRMQLSSAADERFPMLEFHILQGAGSPPCSQQARLVAELLPKARTRQTPAASARRPQENMDLGLPGRI